MNTRPHAAVTFLILIAPFVIPAYGGGVDDTGVKIRVYVPYSMRLANEVDQKYIIRIENLGKSAIPILSSLTYQWDGRDEPIQSRLQSIEEANSGTPPPVGNWDAIMRQAQPSALRKEPSMLEPGMAIELTGARLATPLLPDGESRIVIQVGPQQFAYSNWVKAQVLPEKDTSDWQVVAEREIVKAPVDDYEYVVHEDASGKWLFARSNQNKKAFWRVCYLPNGEIPVIESDWSRHQAAITFPGHPESTCYYSTLISVSRSRPWPEGAIASDLMGKFIPVDAASPLEFPLASFAAKEAKASNSSALDQTAKYQASDGSLDSPLAGNPPRGRPPAWIWFAGVCVLIAALAVKSLAARK